MGEDHLPTNLGYLCGFYPSIAEVCRRLAINRQQFNKYLSGQARPSRHNMRRICDFFGITESEILLEPTRFTDLVALRRAPLTNEALEAPLRHLERLYQASGSLSRYVGYYYRYFYSFGYPGQIIRSLAVITEKDGKYFWKNLEIKRTNNPDRRITLSKYEGVAFLLADRIFITEYETLLRNTITQMTLYPSYHLGVDHLVGIQTGGPVRRGRRPGASRVLLEYLGRRIDLKKALASSDLYTPGDIDPEIKRLITNEIPPGSSVLEVEQP
jgi:transcriptional regulator with XRE-family HTH domain